MKAEGARAAGCDRGRRRRRRHRAGRRLRRRAVLAGGRPAGRRRPASRKGLELRDPRRAAAALRYRGDAGAARRADRALCAAHSWSRSATASMTAAGRQRVSQDDRAMLGALQRGRDWIWIAGNHDPEPVRDLGGVSAAMFGDRAAGVPPCAGARGRRRRDRRPSASGGARQRARPHGVAPLLRHRRQAHGDAGVRRLYRRAQHPRCAPSPTCSARSSSPRTCWARRGSTPSRRSAAWAINPCRKITEPSQPVASVIIAVTSPNNRPCVRAVVVTNCSKPAL